MAEETRYRSGAAAGLSLRASVTYTGVDAYRSTVDGMKADGEHADRRTRARSRGSRACAAAPMAPRARTRTQPRATPRRAVHRPRDAGAGAGAAAGSSLERGSRRGFTITPEAPSSSRRPADAAVSGSRVRSRRLVRRSTGVRRAHPPSGAPSAGAAASSSSRSTGRRARWAPKATT